MTNKIRYYDKNFVERSLNPEIQPDYVYAIFTLDELWHVASFKTMEQLDNLAGTLGFSYTWDDERRKGKTSIPIHHQVVDKFHADTYLGRAYGISDENLSAAIRFKSLSNGSIVDNLFVNNGKEIRIYRCNPNFKDVYHPLTLEDRIQFHQTHGVY